MCIVSFLKRVAEYTGIRKKCIGTVNVNSNVYSLLRVIGEGGKAIVYECMESVTKEHLAIKRILCCSDGSTDSPSNEVLIHSSLSHNMIVQYINSEMTSSSLDPSPDVWIVMELCAGPSLQQYINNSILSHSYLSAREIYSIVDNLFQAVGYIHSQSPPITHFDIKPENFLLCNGIFKICDFGSAATVYYQPSSVQEILLSETELNTKMTQLYRSPESLDLWSGQKVDTKCDIWSLGVLIYTLIYGELPFDGSPMDIINGIPKQVHLGNSCAYELKPLLELVLSKMLVKNPNDRANIFELSSRFSLFSHYDALVCPLPGVQSPQTSRF